MMELEERDPTLVRVLRELMATYGPKGVVDTAAQIQQAIAPPTDAPRRQVVRDYGPFTCVTCGAVGHGTRRALHTEGWALTPLHPNVYCPACRTRERPQST